MALKFPVGISIEAIDNATAKTRAIVSGISKATAPLSKLQTSFQGLTEAAQFPKLMAGFRGVGSALGDLGAAARRSALLVGGLAAAAGGAAFALVKSFAEAGDSAFKGAQKIGIGVEALQELRYAAELANVETEAFDASLVKLTRNAGLAARGQKSAAKPFERLGISVTDSNGKIRESGDLLAEIADKFGRLDDPLKKAALAQELFGKTGANLIPLLAGGRKGLEAAAAEARRLGIVLSTESAAGGEEFMDSLTRIGAALRGLRNAIGAQLLPILLDLADKFREWLVSNLPAVKAFAERLARDLPAALRRVANGFALFWAKTEPVRKIIGKVYDLLGPLGSALAVVGGILLVTLTPAIVSVVSALATLSAALVATPAGWVVLALVGIAAALAGVAAAALYCYAHWDELSARFPKTAAVVERLSQIALAHLITQLGAVAGMLELVLGSTGSFTETFLAKIELTLSALSSLWDGLRSGFSSVYDWIAGKLASLVDLVPSWARDLIGLSSGPGTSAAVAAAAPDVASSIAGPGSIQKSEATVKVELSGLPRGTRVSSEEKGGAALDLSMGYALSTP